MKFGVALVAVLVLGCAKDASAPGSTDCDAAGTAVAAKAREVLSTEERGAELERRLEAIKNAVARHCTDDGWPSAAQACFKSLATRGEGCSDTLTSEQLDSLEADPTLRRFAHKKKVSP